MRTPTLVLALLTGCSPATGGGRIEPDRDAPPMPVSLRRSPLTTLDIIRMTEAGLDEQAVLDRIAAEGVTARPTADTRAELRAHDVSERILAALDAAEVVPREYGAPPPGTDAVQPWWFVQPRWHEDDYGRTLQVR